MGVTPDEFYDLSPAEFHYAMEDYNERQAASLDIVVQTMWETTRARVFYHMRLTPGLKPMPETMKDAFKLSWDKEEKQTVEQMKKVLQSVGRTEKNKEQKMKRRKAPK